MTSSHGAAPQIALVGAGYWGRNLARNFAELGALAAIVDTHAQTASAIAVANGARVDTLDAVLMDDTIQGVAIATRAETHFTLAKMAVEAGKHVYVEKPLVLDVDEADALIAMAADAGRVLMVGHLLRFHPKFEQMLEIVRSGQFGPLQHIYSDRLSLGKIRTEENVLWSFAPHDISMLLALAGEDPVAVSAQGTAVVNEGIADSASIQLRFPSGIRAEVRASWLHFRKVQQIVALCRDATIVFEDSEPEWDRKLSIHPYSIELSNGLPIPERGEVIYPSTPRDEPLRRECRHFLDCIAAGSRPVTDGEEGRAVLKVLQAASHSLIQNSSTASE